MSVGAPVEILGRSGRRLVADPVSGRSNLVPRIRVQMLQCHTMKFSNLVPQLLCDSADLEHRCQDLEERERLLQDMTFSLPRLAVVACGYRFNSAETGGMEHLFTAAISFQCCLGTL